MAASGAGDARTTGVVIRALAAGCVGNFVEWYDFAIYSYSVTIIATLFFPAGNRAAAIIAAFALYGVAFLARPVGGATMLIGLLPTYGTIGIMAPVLLALLRLVQGFSGGGEFTGSTSFISEYAPEEKRGLFASISATFTTLPSLLGGLTVFAVAAGFGEEAYAAWGWRIPFLVGGPLALVGLFIRLRMDETPAFRELKEHEEQVERTPAREAIREHGRSILLVFAIASLSALGAYTLGTYFVTYLQEVVGLSRTTSIAANFLAFFVTVPLVPLVGMLGDRIGRKPLLLIGTPGFILLSLPGYLLASSGTFLGAIVGQLLVALPWSFVVSAVVVIIVEIFPTRVRYSGASIGYNLGYMIFGGTAPIVATYLVSATGSNSAPAIYLIVVAVLVLPAVFMLPETRGVDLLRGGDRARPTESARPTTT
jgi:MFS transporter, MHS family, proline/betaine transporter